MKSQLKTRLKAARRAAGYQSLSQFCKEHHLHKSSYSQHESGNTVPRDTILQKYCHIFDVNFDWLKHGKGSPYLSSTGSSDKKIKLYDEIKSIEQSLQASPQPLQETLLSGVITLTLEKLEASSKSLTPETIAELIIGIYTEIVSSESDPEIQTLMVPPTVAACIRIL